jgi:2'-5' RNA ligase
MQRHTHERACAVIVEAPEIVARINAIREKCDPAYPRWMPHINLIYPFLTHPLTTPALLSKARAALGDLRPFKVSFSGVSFFAQRDGKWSVHLCPDDVSAQRLQEVQRALARVFPSSDSRGGVNTSFTPHLTIAVYPVPPSAGLPSSCTDVASFTQLCSHKIADISFEVKEVVIMDRHPARGEPQYKFGVLERLTLGVGGGKQLALRKRHVVDASFLGQVQQRIRGSLIDFALRRACRCLRRMGAQRKLPRTVAGVEAVLRPFLKQRVKMDVQEVMKHYLSRGVIEKTTSLRRVPAADLQPPAEDEPAEVSGGGQGSRGRGRGRGGEFATRGRVGRVIRISGTGRGARHGVVPVSTRGRGRGAAPAARGRGGRGRGGAAEAPPGVEMVQIEVPTVRINAPSVYSSKPDPSLASSLAPFGAETPDIAQARLWTFLHRLIIARQKQQERNAATKSAADATGEVAPEPKRGGRLRPASNNASGTFSRPQSSVHVPLSAFEAQLRDVCTVPCLVPMASLLSKLTDMGALRLDETLGTVAIDTSRLTD